MKCIIVDDEPIARIGIKKSLIGIPQLELTGEFNSAESASLFMENHAVDLVFLDIQMSGVNGLEFARSIPRQTLVIFTTAFSEYAVDSYEVDAVDYLVKPIDGTRFRKAVDKAIGYHQLLMAEEQRTAVENTGEHHIFIRSERRFFKVRFDEILFIEGLKDYVVIQLQNRRLITR
ncbi:MAG TPA: DNA-binding response regulator, partial [Porphyromonadaceae bacterium]|nr:DNA-binding response regulator [Porphyromonadaceae bacterium]